MGGSFVNNMIEYDAEYKKTPDILHMQKKYVSIELAFVLCNNEDLAHP